MGRNGLREDKVEKGFSQTEVNGTKVCHIPTGIQSNPMLPEIWAIELDMKNVEWKKNGRDLAMARRYGIKCRILVCQLCQG